VSRALQVAVVHLPLLNEAFSTRPLSPAQWAVCAALGSLVLVAGEAHKLVRRRRHRRRHRR
jgi:Ca2+-transporting ATPase